MLDGMMLMMQNQPQYKNVRHERHYYNSIAVAVPNPLWDTSSLFKLIYSECVSKELPIDSSSSYAATLPLIWMNVSGHLMKSNIPKNIWLFSF